jgi:type IV pilus assembly protein PilA
VNKKAGFTLIELLIVVAIIGIIAAIAIPSLLRARVSANESATVGDIRTVISAEASYHSANEGHYGVMTCLSTPSNAACIAAYPATAPTFLDPLITALPNTKTGYVRTANYTASTGPEAGDTDDYCYQAMPSSVNRTGVRSFGGDSSGALGGTQGSVACCVGGALVAACPGITQ